MDLSEIESKADELLDQMFRDFTGPAGASEMRDICTRMDVLERAARIKATVAYRREQALPDLTLQAEPTKPAADRLHELTSYLIGRATENRTPEYPAGDVADAYDDAATKLQEILNEGGI